MKVQIFAKETAIVWSSWRELEKLEQEVYDGPAVYRIRICDSGKIVSIQRFLDSDDRGLLCIGKATHLKKRLGQFKRRRNHSEAELLSILEEHTSLSARYPNGEHEYSYIEVKNPGEENKLEEKYIKAYVKRFGETPPLNSAIPYRDCSW